MTSPPIITVRRRRPHPLLQTLYVMLGVCLTAIGLWTARHFICFTIVFLLGYRQAEFDSVAWKTNWTCRCTPVRMQMSESLLATQHLQGQTKQAVVELLGPPDRNTYWQQYEKPDTLIYYLAPDIPFGDHIWFVIPFESDGLVSNAHIVRE